MFTWKSAYSASSCSFLSRTFRLFLETSSGVTLSMEICSHSSPASFRRSMRSADQQVSVGDQAGDHAVLADAADDVVELRMQQRLAAADGDHGRAQLAQLVHAAEHGLERHRLGEIVVLVAVFAGQIAAAHGDDVRQQRMIGGGQGAQHLRAPRSLRCALK